jgi:nicotinate-nucleotide pyrophosphorylase (carboxylating)
MVLIKDNHIAVAGSVKEAIKRVKEKVSFCKKVEVEVTKVDDVLTAAEAGVNVIMLDNFSPKQIEKTIKLLKKHGLFGKVLLEASGGITSQNILTFASTGIDIVSLGELTDSTKSLDMSLEIKS